MWEKHKYFSIKVGDLADGIDGKRGGKLKKPGNRFFLHLEAEPVKDLN